VISIIAQILLPTGGTGPRRANGTRGKKECAHNDINTIHWVKYLYMKVFLNAV
jgi:hypothetical protein